MEVRMNTLTPELFLALYQSVGWEPPCIEPGKNRTKKYHCNLHLLRWGPACGNGQSDR